MRVRDVTSGSAGTKDGAWGSGGCRNGGSVLTVTDLGCERGDRSLFAGVSFELDAGQLLQVEGVNGSGKTTLLRILCGLTPASSGQVRLHGRPVPEMRGAFTYVGHASGVTGALTPLEHLEVAASLHPQSAAVDPEQILARLGIAETAETPCRHLSAGQQRRVALARLLIAPAQLWVLDEPFTALDRAGVALVERLIDEHLSRDGAVVLTTHQPLCRPVFRRVVLEEIPWGL
jgi:heme exporter protein A